MAVLKYKDVTKMDKKERESKLSELKLELTKSYVTANKTNAKNKEIKKAIARLITVNKSKKESIDKTNKHE